MWTPDRPDDFSRFLPTDFPAFLAWWEEQHSNAIALQLTGAFIEGVTYPYLELLARDQEIPVWLQTLLRWRLAAQWVYQVGLPLAQQVQRGLASLLPIAQLEGFPSAYKISPKEIAEVPPQIRQGFLEGAKFSLSWVKRLSNDAREQMRGLIAINQLKNRNPENAVTLLEQVLRRDLMTQKIGTQSITPEQVQQWLETAEFKVLEGLAKRAELIAVTEQARMQNMGILTSMEQSGSALCYVMPHRGTCPDCQRLLDGRVFRIEVLKRNLFENFGKRSAEWVAAMPQHPRCRHSPMDVPFQFRQALKLHGKIPDEGLLLEYYGLPGGRAAFESLGLEIQPWLTKEGKFV